MLNEEQIYTMYKQSFVSFFFFDKNKLKLDKLVIPQNIFEAFCALDTLKTNNLHNNFRGPLWIIDLVLCGLNVSVICPHFKGSRS